MKNEVIVQETIIISQRILGYQNRYEYNDTFDHILGSIVVSIPACHAGDRGSIPRRGGFLFVFFFYFLLKI